MNHEARIAELERAVVMLVRQVYLLQQALQNRGLSRPTRAEVRVTSADIQRLAKIENVQVATP